ncbi:alpha/beta fold hydrolase [Haloarchaeobius amylolyticus]|uniref:alpha/beta fold hydrolase n=1 Tax=Haloarchaeobius amylolyticus TaxID=1198296 RepID=UPI00226F6F90|nr:alpha/beta hydrolase [Haloarchaeobius amylolyticus]
MASDDDRSVQRYRTRPRTVATDRGDGPPLVLCHGTLMDRTMFDPQVEALSDQYRVVAYDTRARTDRYADSYDLYDLADDCAALMDALDIDSCVLGGMSMGGFMALRFAERYPDRVDGLVLIDLTAGTHSDDEIQQYRSMIESAREAEELSADLADVVKHILFGETTLMENPALVETWVDRWLTYPGEAVYQEVDSWLERPDFTDELADIDVPALVVHGEEDVALAPDRSDALVEQLDARRELIPAAGHSSNVENPDPVNEAIREFLEDVY